MEKKYKKIFAAFVGVATIGILASCNSFCSTNDNSHLRYAFDPINIEIYENKEQAYSSILNDFSNTSNIDTNKVSKEYLTFVDDEGEINYSDDSVAFESRLFSEISNNLVCIKPGQVKISDATNEEDVTSRSDVSFYVSLNDTQSTLFASASSSSYFVPSYEFIYEADLKLLNTVVKASTSDSNWNYPVSSLSDLTFDNLYGYSYSELVEYNSLSSGDEKTELENKMIDERSEKSLLANFGYLKHYKLTTDEDGDETVDYMGTIKDWNDELSITLGNDKVMSNAYLKAYETQMSTNVSSIKTCITVEEGFYGNLVDNPLEARVKIEAKASDFWKDWGEAFTKHGFLEGLLVYPIGVFTENLAHSLGMNGWGQIGAVLIVTIVIRLLFMSITLPSTISQQKMSYLQPEIAKLQQKYPNSDTNQYDKQRLAQAQMALYKKNNVHPFLSMLTLFIQFPLFICVWNALSGSASLSTDAVLGLKLSETIWGVLSNLTDWPNNSGWWTALVLILLMSLAQIASMLLPNLLNKKRNKEIEKLNKSSAANKSQNQMKWMQYIMTAFIIFMGFTLPAAMGVYWFAGAIFSIAQTLILHFVFKKKFKKGEKK